MFQPFKSATKEPRTNMAAARAMQNQQEMNQAEIDNAQMAENLRTFAELGETYNTSMDAQGRSPIADVLRDAGILGAQSEAQKAAQKSAQEVAKEAMKNGEGSSMMSGIMNTLFNR
jgi:hypothetical protein